MTHLQEGDAAPEINAPDQNGKNISIKDFEGQKVVLFFYPKDDTPTCTKEACNLRDNYTRLKQEGFAVLGVSADTQRKHQNFINKYDLPFPLVSDKDHKVLNAYGVWGPKKFMGREFDGIHRTTFVIGEKGSIERVFTKVKSAEHTEQILETYQAN